jgi:hypothetical protein
MKEEEMKQRSLSAILLLLALALADVSLGQQNKSLLALTPAVGLRDAASTSVIPSTPDTSLGLIGQQQRMQQPTAPSSAPMPALRKSGNQNLVLGLLVASSILDIESSYAAIRHCSNCTEGNKLLGWSLYSNGKPNRLKAYTFQSALNLGIYYLSRRTERKLPMLMMVATHLAAGGLNMRYAW